MTTAPKGELILDPLLLCRQLTGVYSITRFNTPRVDYAHETFHSYQTVVYINHFGISTHVVIYRLLDDTIDNFKDQGNVCLLRKMYVIKGSQPKDKG